MILCRVFREPKSQCNGCFASAVINSSLGINWFFSITLGTFSQLFLPLKQHQRSISLSVPKLSLTILHQTTAGHVRRHIKNAKHDSPSPHVLHLSGLLRVFVLMIPGRLLKRPPRKTPASPASQRQGDSEDTISLPRRIDSARGAGFTTPSSGGWKQ